MLVLLLLHCAEVECWSAALCSNVGESTRRWEELLTNQPACCLPACYAVGPVATLLLAYRIDTHTHTYIRFIY